MKTNEALKHDKTHFIFVFFIRGEQFYVFLLSIFGMLNVFIPQAFISNFGVAIMVSSVLNVTLVLIFTFLSTKYSVTGSCLVDSFENFFLLRGKYANLLYFLDICRMWCFF